MQSKGQMNDFFKNTIHFLGTIFNECTVKNELSTRI